MFRGVVMQVHEAGLMVCDLCLLREYFVETNNASKFSPGDKVYVQYTGNAGKNAVLSQVTTDVFKVDRW